MPTVPVGPSSARTALVVACSLGLCLAAGACGPRAHPPDPSAEALSASLAPPPFDRDSILRLATEARGYADVGAATNNRVTPPDCPSCPNGHITLTPERDNHRASAAEIARGRIMGRLRNEDRRYGYRRFALAPGGTSYWFIYTDRTGRLRSWYISGTNPALDRWSDMAYIHRNTFPQVHSASRAEWRWPAGDPPDEGGDDHGPSNGAGVARVPRATLRYHTEGWTNCTGSGCCGGSSSP